MTTELSTPGDVDRLRTLVAELDRLLTTPGQQAAVNADGTPGHVAAGELIESAWGNAVVDSIVTRLATIAHQSGQSIAAGQVVQIAWSQVSDPVFGAGPVFTIPTGKAGVYTLSVRISGPVIPATGVSSTGVFINAGGNQYAFWIPPSQQMVAGSVAIALDPGHTIETRVYNSTADANFFAVTLTIARVAF